MKLLSTVFALSVSLGQLLHADRIEEKTWQFTFDMPVEKWTGIQFDDSSWEEGYGGFGTRKTPGSRVSTNWKSKNIWLRQVIDLDRIPQGPAFYLFHDEDTEIYLNGTKVDQFKGHVTEYKIAPLSAGGKKLLRKGKNLIAVHCRQTQGGQAIDVHLIDGRETPELPPARLPEHPFITELMTEWGEKVTVQNVWEEYPRPALVRDQWTNLNGEWNYAIAPVDLVKPKEWSGKILVPFAVESKLSRVQRLLRPNQALWYQRDLSLSGKEGERTILNFEVVDYEMIAWVNGERVGSHVGGNLPFSFDITDALKDGKGSLLVRVTDATGGYQLKGKQVLDPHGIWYTPVSEIWQTVWVEQVPEEHIKSLTVTTKMDGTVMVKVNGTDAAAKVVISLDGKEIVTGVGSGMITLLVPLPHLWSPDSPAL